MKNLKEKSSTNQRRRKSGIRNQKDKVRSDGHRAVDVETPEKHPNRHRVSVTGDLVVSKRLKYRHLIVGSGTAIDVAPNGIDRRRNRYDPAPSAGDALAGDWKKVGETISRATAKVIKIHVKNKK